MHKLFYRGRLLAACGIFFVAAAAEAQQRPNWQNLDLKTDSVFGISTDKAYQQLLAGKPHRQVIVAVIDAGVDTAHEDLQGVLWINPKKKKGDNGTYGWSYIGSAKGNVHYDNLEVTRQVRQFEQRDTAKLGAADLMAYHADKHQLDKKLAEAKAGLQGNEAFLANLNFLAKLTGKENPDIADLKAYQPQNDGQKQFIAFVVDVMTKSGMSYSDYRNNIASGIDHFKTETEYQLNTGYDPRGIVGDDYLDSKQRNYGSPDNNGPDPTHGTHVSGIIGAVRNNGIGINGIADDIRILNIRAVPDGDERDKDIANAIRYAADHGAKVINMSFGKPYSQDKKVVDEAVQYALKKDVLLVQAAGNSNENIDSVNNFPNRKFLNGKLADAYIVVGASGMKNDSMVKAPFSNYGKTAVDVFAPGVQIYSTIPGSKYAYFDGTSMACPVVAGLAALIREYHPKLSALQVKQIIMESVVVTPYLGKYCRTSGVVNAFNALSLAAEEDQN